MQTYDRYSEFRIDGQITKVPFIKIPVSESDFYETYQKGKTRLDKLSYDYYKNPNYGWFILMANPEVGGLEYRIEDGTQLRIPYPLNIAMDAYVTAIREYKKQYII